jgi:hypothetical protein
MKLEECCSVIVKIGERNIEKEYNIERFILI